MLWKMSLRINKKEVWVRTKLWIDCNSPELAKKVVQQTPFFYQMDISIGGIQWSLVSKHFQSDAASLAPRLARLCIQDGKEETKNMDTFNADLKNTFVSIGRRVKDMCKEKLEKEAAAARPEAVEEEVSAETK